jgi:hypothetical protein
MRRSSVVFLVLLAACGDSQEDSVSDARGTPVTPQEMAEALRQRDAAGAKGDPARAFEDATAAIRERVGGDLAEAAAKAQAMGERPLTAADVETYLAVFPKVRSLHGTPAEMSAVLAEHGLGTLEWGVLSSRITAARFAERLPPDKMDPKIAADVATVRPFADRIEALRRAR